MCPSLDLPEGQKLRVLVVDDEPTLRLGFAYALSNRTTSVETAANGRLALERIAATTFDLVILDLRMPEMDGIAVIEALRAGGNEVPVILCSAALTPAAALRAIRRGVVDFLLKPVRPSDLRGAIEFVVQPKHEPLPQAMKAARNREFEKAIALLEAAPHPCARTLVWLTLLQSVWSASSSEENEMVEERLRTNLPRLAFNASFHP